MYLPVEACVSAVLLTVLAESFCTSGSVLGSSIVCSAFGFLGARGGLVAAEVAVVGPSTVFAGLEGPHPIFCGQRG